MSASRSAQRATIRRLIAEQTEFGLAIPPVVFRQTDFPNGTMQPKPKANRKADTGSRKVIPIR